MSRDAKKILETKRLNVTICPVKLVDHVRILYIGDGGEGIIIKISKPTHLISFDKYGGKCHSNHKMISNVTHQVQNCLKSTELIPITKYSSNFTKAKL